MANPNPAASIPGSQAADQAALKNNALWYTFQGIGRAYLVQVGTIASSDARASGAHGYKTIEQAYTNPNTVNTLEHATITQWDLYASLPVGGGTAGVIETINVTAPVKKGQAPQLSTPQNPVTAAVKSVTSPLDFIASGAFWVRAGEVFLGLILVAVGTVKLAETNKAAQQVVNSPVLKTGFKYAKYLVK